jgi:hypothetical protein
MGVEDPNPGYAYPAVAASPSPAAPIARALSLLDNVSSGELGASRVIIDQGNLPSCVSSSLTAAVEVLNAGWPRLAPLFHYYVTRHVRGGADSRGFLFLENGLETLNEDGICKHELHRVPFNEEGSRTKPAPAAFADALTRAFGPLGQVRQYDTSEGPSRAAWVRDQLRLGRPVVVGFQLPAGYHQSFLNPRHEWLNPNVGLAGVGHCVLIRGYDDLRQALHVQDSRGELEPAFEAGCWWMGYRVADSHVVLEAYSLSE